MEFDEHEEQEEEIEMQTGNFGNSSASRGAAEGVSAGRKGSGGGTNTTTYRYRECLKNHAVGIGGNAVDGCGEFMPAGEDGTLDALKCAACNCHRNFHRKESEGEGFHQPHHPSATLHHHHPPHPHHHHQFYSFRSAAEPPSGYLHVTPPRPLPLPSTSREDEDVSNPSSSGGGSGGSKKRFRTKFTPEQKDKMLGFAERVGWTIQKQDEAAVQQFCAETNVKRKVLKVWMHNNKHTLGKKP